MNIFLPPIKCQKLFTHLIFYINILFLCGDLLDLNLPIGSELKNGHVVNPPEADVCFGAEHYK